MNQSNNRAYLVYLFLAGATSFFFATMTTVSSIYRVDVGLTPMQLVLVGTVLELSVLLAEVPTGIVADLYSRKLSIIIGYLLIGAGFLLEGSLRWIPTIFLAQAVWGIGYTFTSGAQDAWLADEIGQDHLTHAYLRASQIGQIAGLIGIWVSVGFASISLGLPLMIGGGGMMLMALFLVFLMPETGFQPTAERDSSTWQTMVETFQSGTSVVRGNSILIIIFVISLCYGLSSEGWDRFWEAHLLTNFELPDLGRFEPVVWFGIINFAATLLSLAVTEMVRRRLSDENEARSLQFLMLFNTCMIIGVLVFAVTANFNAGLIALWMVMVARRNNYPIFAAWLNRQIDRSAVRATVLSMHGQMDAMGQIVSGPLMGFLATIGTLRTAFIGVVALLTPIVPLLGYAGRIHRRKQDEG